MARGRVGAVGLLVGSLLRSYFAYLVSLKCDPRVTDLRVGGSALPRVRLRAAAGMLGLVVGGRAAGDCGARGDCAHPHVRAGAANPGQESRAGHHSSSGNGGRAELGAGRRWGGRRVGSPRRSLHDCLALQTPPRDTARTRRKRDGAEPATGAPARAWNQALNLPPTLPFAESEGGWFLLLLQAGGGGGAGRARYRDRNSWKRPSRRRSGCPSLCSVWCNAGARGLEARQYRKQSAGTHAGLLLLVLPRSRYRSGSLLVRPPSRLPRLPRPRRSGRWRVRLLRSRAAHPAHRALTGAAAGDSYGRRQFALRCGVCPGPVCRWPPAAVGQPRAGQGALAHPRALSSPP